MTLLAAIPDLLTAAGFLLVWMHTEWFKPQWVATGMTTMLLEFFVVHASGFYAVVMYGDGPRGRRVLQLAGLAALYLLMIVAVAWGMHAWWMVGAFFWLTVGKMLAVWNGPTRALGFEQSFDRQMMAMASWALSVAGYLGAMCASVMVDWPAYGVTPDVVRAAGFDPSSSGEWEATPYKALAGGALYFGAMALLRTLLRLILLRRGSRDTAAVV
jgi:hypothetical protein